MGFLIYINYDGPDYISRLHIYKNFFLMGGERGAGRSKGKGRSRSK